MTDRSDELARNWLQSANVRLTRQRLGLACILVGDGKDRHVSAESLHAAALEKSMQVSLATIYNTLHIFRDAGLLNEITLDGNRSYFDTRLDDHPHFFWEETAELTDAPKESVAFETLPDAPLGSEIARVDVVIRLRKT